MALTRISRRLRNQRGEADLPEGQFAVLTTIYKHGPMTPGALADHEHIRPPSMTRTVNALAELGLVTKVGHETDKRLVLVELTTTGRDEVRETRRRREAWLTKNLGQLDPRRTADARSGERAAREDRQSMSPTFASLRYYNYRLWFSAALVANVGTWMQRVAQDWLVLTVLTDNSGTAVGIVTALQFLPVLALSAWAGVLADRVDRRKLLILTQSALGVLALALGALVLSGYAELWHVYVFAALLGCVTAIDNPVRQTFVAEMVTKEKLSNAVGLNSAGFNAARLVGPGAAGLLIAAFGPGGCSSSTG